MSEKPKAKRHAFHRVKCCAFCGQVERQVGVLIEGPCINGTSNVHICGECAKWCAEMVTEFEAREAKAKAK